MPKSPNRPSRLELVAIFTNRCPDCRAIRRFTRREHKKSLFGSDRFNDGNFLLNRREWCKNDLAIVRNLDVEAISRLGGPDSDSFLIISYCSHGRRFPQLVRHFKSYELRERL